MTSDEARNAVKVMVLSDLAAICQKLTENSAVPPSLRERAAEMVEEFDTVLPYRERGSAAAHFVSEQLLIRMARFLPAIAEIQSWPADSSKL
jgi:hypothetical protein